MNCKFTTEVVAGKAKHEKAPIVKIFPLANWKNKTFLWIKYNLQCYFEVSTLLMDNKMQKLNQVRFKVWKRGASCCEEESYVHFKINRIRPQIYVFAYHFLIHNSW